MYDFTPASDPISGFWSPGSFTLEAPISRDQVLARLRGAIRAYRPLFQSRLSSTMTGIVGDDRLRLWTSTYWRSQPNAGALIMDARLEDRGATTYVSGRLRRGYTFIPQAVLWPLLLVWWLGSRGYAPAPFLLVLAAIAFTQLAYAALSSRRDAKALLEFVDLLLSDRSNPRPAPYPPGIPDPAAEFAERYRYPGRPEGG